MSKTVDELAVQAGRVLSDLGYAPTTIRRYRTAWNKVRRWSSEHDVVWFDAAQERRVVEEFGLDGEVLTPTARSTLRHIRTLLAVDMAGSVPAYSKSEPVAVPDRFRDVFEGYASYLERRGLARVTQRGQLCVIRRFLASVRVSDLGALSGEDVTAHMVECSWMTAQTRAQVLYTIRAFARWAAGEGLCSPAVAAAMLVIPGHKHAALPSVYTAGEVSALVATPGEECPKRDRAMLLLAAVLGLRAGDIRALRLGEVDWRAREVRFTQAKTGRPVRLPLPDETMLAVADYLRNERPASGDDHVFLRHRAPHGHFEGASNSFHDVATRAFDRAAVDTSGKHHGMHSLRHSVATTMLADGTAYPVISGILGHSNANTTRRYMAVDIEALRRLSLEVPRG
ncbi:tyrosine-type recombinase/integrase [Streptomyces parvus]